MERNIDSEDALFAFDIVGRDIDMMELCVMRRATSELYYCLEGDVGLGTPPLGVERFAEIESLKVYRSEIDSGVGVK